MLEAEFLTTLHKHLRTGKGETEDMREGGGGAADQTGINGRGRTSLSPQEKSFFLPGAHFSGRPAASSQRGNFKTFVLLSTSGRLSKLLGVSCTLL